MRHHNPKSTSLWNYRHRNEKCTCPYQMPYSFTRPSAKRTYIKVIQYVYDHPKCSRFDIQVDIFGYKRTEQHKIFARGNQSSLFSNLLYANYIDYDRSYKYTVTEKGMKLLKQAYLNDMMSLVNHK